MGATRNADSELTRAQQGGDLSLRRRKQRTSEDAAKRLVTDKRTNVPRSTFLERARSPQRGVVKGWNDDGTLQRL